MKRRVGKLLGITIGQRSLLIAEVAGKGEELSTGQMGEFPIPEGFSLEKPGELGKALGEFLRDRKFSSREAVIGLPAKRLLTRRKDVPPATASVANSMLRLQSEGAFTGDNLVIDYSGETSNSETRSVLLVAAPRETIVNCESLAKAAGIKLRGVTSTATALGQATAFSSKELGADHGVIINLAGGHTELAVQDGRSTSQLRHLSVGENAIQDVSGVLVGEVRRVVASVPRNGSPVRVSVWTNGSEDEAAATLLEQRLGMSVLRPDLKTLVRTSDVQPGVNRFAPAVAVASADLDVVGLPIDFLHSKLTPPPERDNMKLIRNGVAAGLIVLLLIGYAWWSLNSKYTTLDNMRSDSKIAKPKVEEAQTELDRLNYARQFTGNSPRVVACMRDLTALFPDDNSIWATMISVDHNLHGELTGKSMNRKEILDLFERMNATTQFKGISQPDQRADTSKGGIAFSITFTYHPAE